MVVYEVKPNGRKVYDLMLNNDPVGKILLYGVFRRKAEIIIRNQRLFLINPISFWSSSYEITENGKKVFEFKMKWTGKIILNSLFESEPRHYVFKRKGLFKNGFLMLNEAEQELFQINPSFKLRQFNFEFQIDLINVHLCPEYLELLLLSGIYLIELIRSSESSTD